MSSNAGLLLGIVISGLLSRFLGAVFVTAISGTLLVLISLLAAKTKGFKTLLAIDKKMKKPKEENMVVPGE